ncbi:MAG TPA: cytochrome bc complex cytochrome b subunit [Nitrososphaerales archaeon]|nr:cytochrome bc complex cytochrome b subunit [Nitrososphaerales archaeon]
MTEARDDEGRVARLARWFDARLGLSYQFLRPAPQYAINPFYWLGALAVVAFVIQAVTGMLMMLYYVPDPSEAYSSTQFIFQSVSYGQFLESVHLYTAYAMIMLVFMHMMRGYFVSVHKKPREIMWMTGMLMGFVTLGLGFTGYLLPWTVISKSATDVGTGMISALPQPVSSFLSFLIAGGGGDSAELLRFFDLHVVVLPAILLVLLVVKMFMLEAHGISEPVTGPEPVPEAKKRLIPIFPDVSFYLVELAALFGAAMLVISAVFPPSLPPEYSAAAASQYVAQPDWYFLWIYQILKISFFEANGPLGAYGLPVALTVVTLIFVLLLLLPFLDRGESKRLSRRRVFVTLGAIFMVEIAVLTIWGYLTPGRAIPDEQAAVVLGGAAVATIVISLMSYRLLFGRLGKRVSSGVAPVVPPVGSTGIWATAAIVLLLALSTLAMGNAVGALARVVLQGPSMGGLGYFALSAAAMSLGVVGTVYLLYRLDLGAGAVKRRVKALEVGWRE